MAEIEIQNALNESGFPLLRIMTRGNSVTDDGERFISIGVLDSLGNTEWAEVTVDKFVRALLELDDVTDQMTDIVYAVIREKVSG